MDFGIFLALATSTHFIYMAVSSSSTSNHPAAVQTFSVVYTSAMAEAKGIARLVQKQAGRAKEKVRGWKLFGVRIVYYLGLWNMLSVWAWVVVKWVKMMEIDSYGMTGISWHLVFVSLFYKIFSFWAEWVEIVMSRYAYKMFLKEF